MCSIVGTELTAFLVTGEKWPAFQDAHSPKRQRKYQEIGIFMAMKFLMSTTEVLLKGHMYSMCAIFRGKKTVLF